MDFLPEEKDSSRVTSIRSIDVLTRVYPDKEHFYFIESRKRRQPFIKKHMVHELSTKGFLTKGNMHHTSYGPELLVNSVTSTLKTVASIVNPLPIANNNAARGPRAMNPAIYNRSSELHDLLGEIKSLNQQRMEFLSGDRPDGRNAKNCPVKFIVKQLEAEERKLIDVLAGTKKVTVKKQIVQVDELKLGSNKIFESCNSVGICDPTSTKCNSSQSCQDFNLTIHNYTPRINSFWKKKQTQISTYDKNKGIHYRLPATCLVSIENNQGAEFYRKEQVIPQFGSVLYLPARVGIVRNDIDYTLDPHTGALHKFEANAEGIATEQLNQVNQALREVPSDFRSNESDYQDLKEDIERLKIRESTFRTTHRK